MNMNKLKTVKDIINSVKEINEKLEKKEISNPLQTVYYLEHCLNLFTKLKNEKGVIFVSELLKKVKNYDGK